MTTMYSYVPYNQLLRKKSAASEASNSANKDKKVMGGAQASSSVVSQQPIHNNDFPDAPLLNVALARRLTGRSSSRSRDGRFQSFDRGLKVFLRSSNLSGLEYRLKMAGYHTLNDLIEVNVESLCAKGFTPLMARRLISALEIYIQRQLDKMEGLQSPFRMVRKNQQIKSDPSDTVKALPTYGKRNVKRKRSSAKDSRPHSKVSVEAIRPSYVRLMSEESLPSEPIFPNVIDNRRISVEGGVASNVEPSASVGMIQSDEISPVGVAQHDDDVMQEQASSVGVARPSTNVSYRWTMFEEHTLDDIDAAVAATFNEVFVSDKLERSMSVPADYWYDGVQSPPPYSWYRVRAYSCPPCLSSMTTPLEKLVNTLSLSNDVGSVYPALCELLQQLKVSPAVDGLMRFGGEEMIVDVLQSLYAYPNVVEKCCRIVKYLARDAVLPPETLPSLLQAMDCHSTSESIQTHGSLALGNIIRTDPSQCSELVFMGALRTLSVAMETFSSNVQLQVSVFAALAVMLSTHKNHRLLFMNEHGRILDRVLMVMKDIPNDAQLQQYACSFLAMLTAEVGAQFEESVVQLILEHVAVVMTTHTHDSHVNIWSAKVISNSATNAALNDVKLAMRYSELLVEVLVTFSQLPQVQKWCCYGLLQLATQHSCVKDMLKQSRCLSSISLSEEDDNTLYQEQLRKMVE